MLIKATKVDDFCLIFDGTNQLRNVTGSLKKDQNMA
jgi:hypothetical protein